MLQTERCEIKILTPHDVDNVVRYYQDNQTYFSPWEPVRPDDYHSRANWLARAVESERAFDHGQSFQFIAYDRQNPEQLVATCHFSNVIRGVFQACFVGYSVAQTVAGQGYMTEVLQATCDYMFEEQGLNRIMANYMPRNKASGRVLEKAGFEQEGYARRYLKIAGKWEDHVLTAKLAPLNNAN